MVKTWFLGYKEDNLDKVKHCPACGSTNIDLPNDLWEWICCHPSRPSQAKPKTSSKPAGAPRKPSRAKPKKSPQQKKGRRP